MDEELGRQVSAIVQKLGNRIKLMYGVAFVLDLLVNDVSYVLDKKYAIAFSQMKKKYFKAMIAAAKAVDVNYEAFANLDWEGCADGDYSKLDEYREDANELLRFIMMYVDRGATAEGMAKIWSFLESLPSSDIFPKEVIDRFNMRRNGK